MRRRPLGAHIKIIGLCCLVLASTARADESFPSLKVKDQVYTNVTVTMVTPTDIYFTHAQGLASARLKDLDSELQKHFHFDPAKSARIEQADVKATADFKAQLAQQKPAAGSDFVAPKLLARSIRGQPAPKLVIEKWLTRPPGTDGKFILLDFWSTRFEPCRRSIPELNRFQKEFASRLAIIGVSGETEEVVRSMKSPVIDFAVAVDPAAHTARKLEITGVPHCILIDPSGIVRYEGNPLYLNDAILKQFLDKYSK